MKKDDKLYLEDVLKSVEKIESYTSGLDQQSFLGDSLTQDAVIRNLEIIGESARKLSLDFIKTFPNFPVKEATSMRNLLIHEYNYVDFELVWETVRRDLPDLKRQLLEIITSL